MGIYLLLTHSGPNSVQILRFKGLWIGISHFSFASDSRKETYSRRSVFVSCSIAVESLFRFPEYIAVIRSKSNIFPKKWSCTRTPERTQTHTRTHALSSKVQLLHHAKRLLIILLFSTDMEDVE